jgi:hypothetical protein
MDLFKSNELVFADRVAPEATYSAPDGTLLANIVRSDGMVATKRGVIRNRQTANEIRDGMVSLRVEDAFGQSLLTLRGANGGTCEVNDADGRTLGRFEHDDAFVLKIWAASLLDWNMGWNNFFQAWAVRDPDGKVILEIHSSEVTTRDGTSDYALHGGDIRTITTVDGTQVAVWTDEKLTFERDLPSPLRELVIATPMAVKMISATAFYHWSEQLGEHVWERP